MVLARGVLRGTHALSLWPHPHFFLLWRGHEFQPLVPQFCSEDQALTNRPRKHSRSTEGKPAVDSTPDSENLRRGSAG